MIKYNQLNQIATQWLVVWACLEGWELFENDSLESGCVGGGVESYISYKSDVNKTADW